MKISSNAPCPCHSGKKYKKCCQIYHQKVLPKDAKLLMQSRYSAYALCLSDYLIQTTHPNNSQFNKNTTLWKQQIESFCISHTFKSLEIFDFKEDGKRAWVTFKAGLEQNGIDMGFVEKSEFIKEKGRWLYYSAEFLS